MKARFTHYRNPYDLEPSADAMYLFEDQFMPAVYLAQRTVPFRMKAWPNAITRCDLVEQLDTKAGEKPAWAILAVGWAICSSRDQFSRKKGRLIAEGRARRKLAKL